MKHYLKPVLVSFSIVANESVAGAFDDAFNSKLEGLGDDFIFSYDMNSAFGEI